MKTLRSCLGGATALALIGVAGSASAADLTLQIVRDGNGSIVQSIPVDDWSFDARRRVLEVTSTTGDRQCAGAPGASTDMRLNFDGQWYGLKHFTPPSRSRPTLRVYPLADGVFPLCRSGSNRGLVQQTYQAKAAGDLKIELDVISGGRSTRRAFAVGGAISHNYGTGVVTAGNAKAPSTLSEDWPPLCLPGSTGGNQLNFVDTNGQAINLQGVSPTAYRYGEQVLAMTTSSALTCFAVPSTQESPLAKGEATGCGQGRGIFGSGFENTSNLAIDELGVMVQVNTFPTADQTDPLDYDLIVQNCSSAELTNVAVRDFYSSNSATVDGAYQTFSIASLAPGEQQVTTVTRTVSGSLNDEVIITAVAAVNDGSSLPQHQIKSWNIPVVDTNNVAPTLSGSASLTVSEDASATQASGTLTATDSDSGFSCSGGSCVQVSSSNSSIISASGVTAAFNEGAITLSVTPQPNAYTTADQTVNLSIRVQDADGALSNVITVPVTVTAVNDPPTFEIASGFDRTTSAKALTVTGSTYCPMTQSTANGQFALADASCPSQDWEANPEFPNNSLVFDAWISNLSAGPNESGTPTLDVSLLSNVQGIIGNWVYEPGPARLTYELTGAKGTATLRVTANDGEVQTTADVNISVDNAQPVITSNGGGASASINMDENQTAVTTVTADDADDDPSTLTYSISGTDSGDFDIDPSSGELSFAAPPDFEAPADSNGDNVYRVTVTASDGSGGSGSQALTVTVADVNEAPVIAAGQVFQVEENSAFNTVVGLVSASDPEGDALTGWTITGGNTSVDGDGTPAFVMNGNEIRVADPDDLDFESGKTQFVLTIEVSDGINPAVSGTVTVDVTDVAE